MSQNGAIGQTIVLELNRAPVRLGASLASGSHSFAESQAEDLQIHDRRDSHSIANKVQQEAMV